MAGNLSAEGQHLIDALEAHFAAIRAWVTGKAPDAEAHVELAWDDVKSHLEATEAQFRQAAAGQAEVGRVPAPAVPTSAQAADAAKNADAGEPWQSNAGAAGTGDAAAGKPASIGELVTANTVGSSSPEIVGDAPHA